MKPLTLKWIEKYRTADHKPTTPDVIFAVSAPEEDLDSEKSYKALTTGSDIFVSYIFLYQSPGFMFLATIANIMLFAVNTYAYAYLQQKYLYDSPVILVIHIICYIIIILEIISSVLHLCCKKLAAERAITPRHWVIITIDSLLQLTVFLISLLLNTHGSLICLLEIFRLFRVFVFYDLISSTPGKHTVIFSLLKFSMITVLIMHISAIFAQVLNVQLTDFYEESWHKQFMETCNEPLSQTNILYTYFALTMLSALGNMGIVGASLRNNIEQALTIILCLFGLIYINGIFLGNFTSIRLNLYQIKTIYYNKLKLINKNLADYKVPKRIRTKIKNYYIEFWNHEGAIVRSLLVAELPLSLQYQIYLDKYWFAFEYSNIFPETHYAFKRALSYLMETRIYSTGETVYAANSDRNTMIYIHLGNIQVLSAEDMESPLITLSAGTIIGETSLIASSVSPLQIIASTYCVAYCLNKLDFWQVVNRYRKLKQGEIIHTKTRAIFTSGKYLNKLKTEKVIAEVESLVSLEGMLKNAIEKEVEGGPKLRYILSQHFGKRNRIDEIFLRTTFPWILNPNSRLIFYWDLIIVIFTFVVASVLPYSVAFRLETLSYYQILDYYMNAFFILDMAIFLFVAIEDEKGLRSTVMEIIMERLHSSFILDIIAALPIKMFLNIVALDIRSNLIMLFPFFRLVKFHKIVQFFSKIENSFKFNLVVLRLIKYILYLAFCAYLMAAIYYILACDESGFLENSWVTTWKVARPQLTDHEVFMNTFRSSFEVVVGAGIGVLAFRRLTDLIFIIIFIVVGILMFTYIAGDYSATMTLNEYELGEYSKIMQTIEQLALNPLYSAMECKINMSRIYSYLSSQWYFNRGSKIKELLSDGPTPLYELQQMAKYAKILEKIPFFAIFGRGFCNRLSSKCEEVQFSENTIFVNECQTCEHMYIIEKGYCELIAGATRRIEKTLGPGSNTGIIEAMLGINNLFFVRSITCVALIRISKINLHSVIRTVPVMEIECKSFKEEMKNSILYSNFLKMRVLEIITEGETMKNNSFFIFPNDKTDPLYQDYVHGWTKCGIFRYVMLPLSIMPDGPFIRGWEIFHNICCFLLVTVALTYDYWSAVSANYATFMRILEGYQLIAIFIRFHICYYNKNGILISHPRLTGYHYLTGAFIVDILGTIPISKLFVLITKAETGAYALLNFNKVLLMYRLPTAFHYFTHDVLKPRTIVLNVCFFTPLTIIYLLAFTCIIIATGSDIVILPEKHVIVPKNDSILWLLTHLDDYLFKTTEPFSLYMITLYYTASNAMQLGCHGIITPNNFEVFVVILLLLSGYMFFAYVLVIITNSQTIINSELTLYQSHMKNILKFMKEEKVPKYVQSQSIQYYEYSWKQMHGLNISDVLNRCHTVLCEDFLYDQYKNTFDKVTIFQNLDSTIYREFSRELKRIYMLPNVNFIKLNNIVSKMYFVHSGRINVYGPHGPVYTALRVGSIFGCLDNVSNIRSMVSFVSSGSVDLLEIEAKDFYKLMATSVINDLQKHILLTNLTYVKGRNIRIQEEEEEVQEYQIERKESWKTRFLNSLGINMTFLLTTVLSIISVTYFATFFRQGLVAYLIIYTYDILHAVFLIIKMFTPYNDSKGQRITDRRLIRKRLVRTPLFYFNLLGLIPIDAIFLIDMGMPRLTQELIYRTLLMTRLLRIYNIANFFTQFNDILNSDLLIMKLLSIIVYTTLFLHFETCCFYLLAVRGTYFYSPQEWAYQPTGDGDVVVCGNGYICSFYFATSILTFSGYSIYPRSVHSVVGAIGVAVFCKFISSIAIAKLSACIQNYGADLARFDQLFYEMKHFLGRSDVSEYLIKCIVHYCEQLWIRSKGVQEPYLLRHAPSYLKEQIKISAFGKHIYNNILFSNVHPDFLRHLIRMVNLQIFFKNDIICEQGDINETLYFVHSGSIDVYYSTETEEIKVDEIQELDCFGVIQGLYERTPHTHTFKASSVTVLCTLNLKDWSHFLDFYPASKFEIYECLYNL